MTVIALAGRRIDAQDAAITRFPLSAVGVVRDRVAAYLRAKQPSDLVCAAACGADLIALDTARQFTITTHIVLPFAPELFRQRSVVDRAGAWGDLYDQLIVEAQLAGTLHIEALNAHEPQVFEAANERILARALALPGQHAPVRALIVWDGAPRPHGDVTLAFALHAQQLGMPVDEIFTR
jgi:hypothetical protein